MSHSVLFIWFQGRVSAEQISRSRTALMNNEWELKSRMLSVKFFLHSLYSTNHACHTEMAGNVVVGIQWLNRQAGLAWYKGLFFFGLSLGLHVLLSSSGSTRQLQVVRVLRKSQIVDVLKRPLDILLKCSNGPFLP